MQAVEALWKLGWDINAMGGGGSTHTLLFGAAANGQWALMRWLLGEEPVACTGRHT